MEAWILIQKAVLSFYLYTDHFSQSPFTSAGTLFRILWTKTPKPARSLSLL